jgi:hypothetical protein
MHDTSVREGVERHKRSGPRFRRGCGSFDRTTRRSLTCSFWPRDARDLTRSRPHMLLWTGHAEPRRERPRGRAWGRTRARGPGSFTPRFYSCADADDDRGGTERRPIRRAAHKVQIVAVTARCCALTEHDFTSRWSARAATTGLRQGVEGVRM